MQTPTPTPKPYYYYHQISNQDSLTVIPNFENPIDSSQIIQNYNCKYAINGGLYLQDNRPLGLFVHQNKKYNKLSSSPTFNGFLFQDDNNILDIGKTASKSPSFIMQSGPFFNLNAPIPQYNSKTARRHVIAKDNQNNLYIFSIFSRDSFLDGPTLNEIPLFFQKPEIKKIADFTEILTLDGGSASMFYSPKNSIHETTFIGSLLCWK